MKNHELRSDLIMLLVAAIWGSTFVAQRLGMDYVGPFTYTTIRFAISVLVLSPILFYKRQTISKQFTKPKMWQGGILMGLMMTGGINLQQVGLLFTSVTNAGFITGLYVVIVPLLGLLVGVKTKTGTWIGAVLAVIGMFLLSALDDLQIMVGDLLQLAGAVLWALHVIVIAKFARQFDAILLAVVQFSVCSILSAVLAVGFESISLVNLKLAMPSLLYGGILAGGLGYTLQIIAQKHAIASHAAVILASEALFAALAGAIFLGEFLSLKGYLGCFLMLIGILVAQLWRPNNSHQSN